MKKEIFDAWNCLKQTLHFSEVKEFYVREKDVWYIHNGVNIGFESNGKGDDFKRPVLVLKKVGALFFVATMTTKGKDTKFYHKLNKSYFGVDSYVSLSQVKIIDKKRFFEKLGEISGEDFRSIKKELQEMLF